MIARIERQVKEHQWVIAQLTTRNNRLVKRPAERANVEAQLKRDFLVARHEPLLITWKKARPANFDGLVDPLVA